MCKTGLILKLVPKYINYVNKVQIFSPLEGNLLTLFSQGTWIHNLRKSRALQSEDRDTGPFLRPLISRRQTSQMFPGPVGGARPISWRRLCGQSVEDMRRFGRSLSCLSQSISRPWTELSSDQQSSLLKHYKIPHGNDFSFYVKYFWLNIVSFITCREPFFLAAGNASL